jgi:hypothetical protein
MISDADRDILNLFALRVRERFPEARVWAFGSRARGDVVWDSDFAVCVILDRLDAATDHALSDVAWEVGFSHDRVITVIPFSQEEDDHHLAGRGGEPARSSLQLRHPSQTRMPKARRVGLELILLKTVFVRLIDDPVRGNWAGTADGTTVYQQASSPVGGK